MQGYILVATGTQRSYDMAEAAAASLRLRDGTRPIALIHDEHITLPADVAKFFDVLRPIASSPRHVGSLAKLRTYDETPWDQTLFVESDCLLMRSGIERYWVTQSGPMTVWGANRTTGTVAGRDVPAMLARFDAAFTAEFGVSNYFFHKGPVTERVFRRANAMLAEAPELASHMHEGRAGEYANELFIGLAMGCEAIAASEKYPVQPDFVAFTSQAQGFRFDLDKGEASFLQPRRFLIPSRSLLPIAWKRVDPLFIQFTELKPRRLYDRIANDLRARVRAG